jgi:hypothetical protein
LTAAQALFKSPFPRSIYLRPLNEAWTTFALHFTQMIDDYTTHNLGSMTIESFRALAATLERQALKIATQARVHSIPWLLFTYSQFGTDNAAYSFTTKQITNPDDIAFLKPDLEKLWPTLLASPRTEKETLFHIAAAMSSEAYYTGCPALFAKVPEKGNVISYCYALFLRAAEKAYFPVSHED